MGSVELIVRLTLVVSLFLVVPCWSREPGQGADSGSASLNRIWVRPLVQRVRIPAHVQGGVYYPAHDELVIVRPGGWEEGTVRPTGKGGPADLTVLPGINMTERKEP